MSSGYGFIHQMMHLAESAEHVGDEAFKAQEEWRENEGDQLVRERRLTIESARLAADKAEVAADQLRQLADALEAAVIPDGPSGQGGTGGVAEFGG